jgi:uncharacterized membrane protein YsdA (DUF1294 family)
MEFFYLIAGGIIFYIIYLYQKRKANKEAKKEKEIE